MQILVSWLKRCASISLLVNVTLYEAKVCRTKFCRAKLFVGQNFLHQTKTFAWQKFSTNESKSVFNEPKKGTSHLDKLWLYCWTKLCLAKFSTLVKFSSPFKTFVTFARQILAWLGILLYNGSLSLTKNFSLLIPRLLLIVFKLSQNTLHEMLVLHGK